MDEMRRIRVSWQAAIIIISLLLLPIAILGGINLDSYGDRDLRMIAWSFVGFFSVIVPLATWSQLSRVRSPRERLLSLKWLLLGVVILVVATIFCVISALYGAFSSLGEIRFLIPTTIYMFGLFVICWAMPPQDK